MISLILFLFLGIAPPAARAAERPAIAILPFANLQDAAALDWMEAAGDLLALRLRAVRELLVISPDEVQRAAREMDGAAGLSLDVPAGHRLAQMLGADRFLTAGFSGQGARVRLVARWLDPATGSFTSLTDLDRPLPEALKLPGELIRKLLEHLRVAPASAELQWLTTPAAANATALQAYRRGRAAYWHARPADNEVAIALFREAVAADSAFAPAWIAMGQAYYQKFIRGWNTERVWLERAVEAAEKALVLNRLWLEAHLLEAQSLMALGRLSEARQAFSGAATVNPADPSPFQGLAEVSLREGRLNEAVSLYQSALALRPAAAEARVRLGELLARQARWQEAAQEFVQALAQRPRWGPIYDSLGDAQLRLENWDAARESFQKALGFNKGDWSAHYGLARVHAATGQWEQAAAAYQKGLAINAGYPYLHTGLGDAYYHLKRVSDAIGAYQQALRLRPDDVGINYNLAALYALEKRTAQALRYLEKAVALDAGMAGSALEDRDFDNIRQDPRFGRLVRPR